MDIVAAYEQVGTYRGAAALCGTTHKTVRRVIEANQLGGAGAITALQAAWGHDALVATLGRAVEFRSCRPRCA